jgi:phosphoribosylformimino-5-aminoimidazole carboxamide ribotide isomerase
LRALSDTQAIYAAGGIRHLEDLQHLNQDGIHGALIASALHAGTIGQAELASLAA